MRKSSRVSTSAHSSRTCAAWCCEYHVGSWIGEFRLWRSPSPVCGSWMYPKDGDKSSLRALADLTEERPAEVLRTLHNLLLKPPGIPTRTGYHSRLSLYAS